MNSVNLVGRIGKEPDLRYSQSGKAICNMTLAVSDRFNKEKTHWIDCVAWGKTGEIAAEYLRKGSKIGVVGSLQQQRWEKDGKKQSKIIINIEQLEFLESKKSNVGNLEGEKIEEDDPEFPF